MRSHLTAIGLFILAATCSAQATVVDEIGSTGSNANVNSFHGRGNLFQVSQNVTLIQQDFYLNFADSRTMTFCIYESVPGSQMGDYTQIQSNQVAVTGNGSGWYSSGPINVPLQAGKYYIAAFSLPGSFKYYWTAGVDSQAVSFGQQLAGISNIVDPAPATMTVSSDNPAVYYQRLTTLVPEPAAAGLLGLGLATILVRRRNRYA